MYLHPPQNQMNSYARLTALYILQLYNPWSVANYVGNAGDAKPYWINTASTELIDSLATKGGAELREEVGQLLEGGTITKPVYDSIVMKDLEKQDDILWSFLMFSGYLKTEKQADDEIYHLKIPNHEVKIIYRNLIRRWFAEKTESNQLEEMLKALDSDVRWNDGMLPSAVQPAPDAGPE